MPWVPAEGYLAIRIDFYVGNIADMVTYLTSCYCIDHLVLLVCTTHLDVCNSQIRIASELERAGSSNLVHCHIITSSHSMTAAEA